MATNVLHGVGCPVWTSGYVNESLEQNFAVRNVLCAVDLNSRDQDAVSWAAQLAAENGACLTIAHVTAGMRRWGPGASYTDSRWKETLASDASRRIADLRHEMGIKADDIYRLWRQTYGPEPGCEADEGGPASYRVSPLRGSHAHPRLRYHLRLANSSSERVRTLA